MADAPKDPGGFSVRDQFAGKDALLRPADAPRPARTGGPPRPSRPPRDPSQPPVCNPFSMETAAKTLDWKKVLRGVIRRAWLVGCVTAAFAAVGLLAGLQSSRTFYETRISLLYRTDRQAHMLAASGSTFAIKGLSRMTAVSMLRRNRNLEQVHATLQSPLTVEELRWNTQTKSDKGSDIVLMTFSHAPSKEMAVRILNELSRVALNDNAIFYRSQAEQVAEAFREQGRAAKKELDLTTEALAAYQSTNRLIEPSADAQAFLTSVGAATEKLSAARIASESQVTRIANYRQILQGMPDEVLRESIEDNPLKRRISNTEIALMEARTKYGPDNPRVRALEDEIKEMRRLMTDKTYNENRERVFEANPTKKQFETELLRMEAERVVLEQNAKRLETECAAVGQRFAFLPRQQIEVATMQEKRKAAEELYRAMEKTAENAAMAGRLDLGDFEILEPARDAVANRSSRVWLFPAAALLAGLALGMLLSFAIEVFDPKLRTARQVEIGYTVPCLGLVEREPDPGAAAISHRFLPVCRLLYEQAARRREGPPVQSLAVLSAGRGEGKSTLAFQIARYWAQSGVKTACVDFDATPNPAMPPPAPIRGIEDYLRGSATWEDVISQREGVACLKLLHPTPELPELLHTDAMARFWAALRTTYAFVVVEAPYFADDRSAVLLASLTDQSVFIVGSPLTHKSVVDAALDRLDREGLRPMGIVLNLADERHT